MSPPVFVQILQAVLYTKNISAITPLHLELASTALSTPTDPRQQHGKYR